MYYERKMKKTITWYSSGRQSISEYVCSASSILLSDQLAAHLSREVHQSATLSCLSPVRDPTISLDLDTALRIGNTLLICEVDVGQMTVSSADWSMESL